MDLARTKISKEVSKKYAIKDNSFVTVAKDEVNDRIQVELGDTKDKSLFQNQMKIMRFDNEVNASFRLVENEEGEAKITTEKDKVVWSKGNIETRFYDLEDGMEMEISFKEKPVSNVVTMTINTKGLDFIYQGELTEEEIADGAVRPDNVVGSYAVYTSHDKINTPRSKEYRTGKVGHIYRPRIEDANGSWVWGDLNIDKEAGLLTVTIPQVFLLRAVYPIKHAAGLTFGYTTAGGTTLTMSNMIRVFYGTATPGQVTSISMYLKSDGVNTTHLAKGALYNYLSPISSSTLIAQTPETSFVTADTTYAWRTFTFTTPVPVIAANYYAAVWGKNMTGAYDGGNIYNQSGNRSLTYAANFPNPSGLTSQANKYSIYATYTESSTGTNWIIDDYRSRSTTTVADAVSKAITKVLSESITVIDAQQYSAPTNLTKTLNSNATITDTIRKRPTLNKASSTTVADANSKIFILRTDDSITMSDEMIKAIGLVKTENTEVDDKVVLPGGLKFSESITVEDNITSAVNYVRSFSEDITVLDNANPQRNATTGNYMVYEDGKLKIIVNGAVVQVYG